MTDELFPSHGGDPHPGGACGISGNLPVPEIVRHLTLALSGHVRRLRHEGLSVPPEVEELTAFLVRLARMRQDTPSPANGHAVAHYAHVPERLLVTKGEAAERLAVSVRTIERLVATGRLRQVHVERSARFRVSDLEAYVNNLGEGDAPDAENHDGQL
jgi:excisionase family DNA binding protein